MTSASLQDNFASLRMTTRDQNDMKGNDYRTGPAQFGTQLREFHEFPKKKAIVFAWNRRVFEIEGDELESRVNAVGACR